MTIVRSIPITENGQLIPEAGMLVLGYMMYPNCERSAHQFTRILAEETVAKALDPQYCPGEIMGIIIDDRLVARLILAGEVAQRVCTNHVKEGSANFNRAAHVVAERNANIKTVCGKPLPTDKDRLKATFRTYRATIHFWAAVHNEYLMEDGNSLTGVDVTEKMCGSPEFLGQFLAVAKQFEEMLAEAKPSHNIWSTSELASTIWDFEKLPTLSALPELPETVAALSSYRSQQKS